MLNWRLSKAAQRAAASAVSLAAVLALAACEERPYPSPASAPPPPPPFEELAGPPPQPPMPPPAPQASAPVVIAMAPIPNPPERPRRAQPQQRRPAARYTPAPARPAVAAPAPTPRVATAPAPKAAAPAPKVAVAPPPGKPSLPKTTPAVPKGAPAVPKVAPGSAPADADRPTRLAALETALKDAIAKSATLNVPTFTEGQPADVSLTIPAAFSETLRDEAGKQNLADAATSANLTAILSGDGFAVTPDAIQSQPLTMGQPTEFHWTVTPAAGQRGSLHADVGADLLGAGSDSLSLGRVEKGQGGLPAGLTPRMLGGALLALIAILVIGWLFRGRGGPSRSSTARRASRRVRGERPLDLGDAPSRA